MPVNIQTAAVKSGWPITASLETMAVVEFNA